MARNSRFRSTSGPSSNRPFSKKGKPFKKAARRGNDVPGREGTSPQSRSRSNKFGGKGRPFPKDARAANDGSGKESNSLERSSPFKESRGKGKPFQKSTWRKTDSENAESGELKRRSDGNRLARSFSKEHFTRKQGDSGSFSKPEKSSETNSPDREKPIQRKSLVDSRLEKSKSPAGDREFSEPRSDLIRLNKYISNSGICSRREADDLITMGVITVNGKSVTEMGYKVKVTDDVRYEGKRLKSEKPVYILLNKPKGFITTTDDPQERNTVMHLIQGACKERVYPVGRLDRNTSGILLLTNDGDLTEKLTHPSHNIKKIYKVELSRPITKGDFQKVIDGVRLEEGTAAVDDMAIISEDGKTVGLEIHIGWNRVVRRIFEALDYEVVKLDRSVYATLDKKDLPRGHWRFLRQDEVIRLKHFQ